MSSVLKVALIVAVLRTGCTTTVVHPYRGIFRNALHLLGILIPLLGMYGCTTTVVQSDVPCPARPHLISITADQQLAMDPQVREIVIVNQVELKVYAKKLEVRAGCD